MHSNKVNKTPETSFRSLETVQLRYPNKTKDLGLKPTKFIYKNINGSHVAGKRLFGASKKAVNPIEGSLINSYLASIER